MAVRHIRRKLAAELAAELAALTRFVRHSGGNVAVIFALSAMPMLAAGGVGVDLTRAMVVKARLAQALDAAGLAVGSAVGYTNAQLKDLANRYFDANYPADALGVPGEVQVAITGNVIRLSVTAELPTTIMALFGKTSLDLSVDNEIVRETKALEVVMVLDQTGSMNGGGKIGALRDAASDLVWMLFGENARPEQLKMAMVPFVTAVNINAPGFSMDWMDTTAQARHHGENFDGPGGARVNHFDLFDGIANEAWKGCVEMRATPYDTLDTPPDPAIPDTRWVPYFWPDDPDGGNSQYSNKYLSDLVGGTNAERARSIAKFNGRNASIDGTPSDTRGPNKSCADPVVPLTNDRDLLLARIDALRAWNGSGTNNAAGLSWGWRVLSPTPPFTEGSPYNDPKTKKALILLTDGENVIWGGWNSHNKSDYSGYGYLAEERLGTDNRNVAKGRIDDKVAELCTRIKAEGIRVYTILFQVNAPEIQTVFRNCATTPDLFFESPTNEELRRVFQQIGNDLSNLRIAR